MTPIIVSTLLLLVLVIGDTIITARLIQRRLLGKHYFLLSLVVGLGWLVTLMSWVLVTTLSRPVILVG